MFRSPSESMSLFLSSASSSSADDLADAHSQPVIPEAADTDSGHDNLAERTPQDELAADGADGSVEPDRGSEGSDDAASTSALSSRSTSSAGTSASSSSQAPARRGIWCCICPDEGFEVLEQLYRSPCRCPNAFAHRSCLQEVLYREAEDAACPLCGARYPMQRRTKPMWRWFWEQESRDDATLFLANLAFSVGNMGVLSMAWMYVLFEYHSSSWLPAASLVSALLIFSVFWVAFDCIRFRLLYMTYQRWHRANTTLKLMLTDRRAVQA
ncbi:hypothetical protein V5799_006442 [Amblyomma americanum]|uniref:RING-CH-type domain-containing protein n=1 Tax=Amblyomma americanum TaxID=6943 RepID=A0AAQ4DWD7_AMBAM